jgi:hypothetical protein
LNSIADVRISEEFAFSGKMNIVTSNRDNDGVPTLCVGDSLNMGKTDGRALL